MSEEDCVLDCLVMASMCEGRKRERWLKMALEIVGNKPPGYTMSRGVITLPEPHEGVERIWRMGVR